MDRDFLDAIWLQFETEAMEHCTSSEDLLLETEFNEYEAAKIDSLFRAFHSLKGLFGTVGLNKTLELTHLIEDVIDKIRSLEVPIDNKIRGVLLKCIDVLKNIITSSSQEREEIVDKNLEVVKQLIVSIGTTDFSADDNIKNIELNACLFLVHNLGNIIPINKITDMRPDIIIVEDNCEGFMGK